MLVNLQHLSYLTDTKTLKMSLSHVFELMKQTAQSLLGRENYFMSPKPI
uniref:Uncharacterized protein n=1 Tax=Anguilla anguilla TaxID=7936 RepID=A0A0E9PUA8_ANGAN